uniref:Uncharacterized protein n=1 Tax=Nelumbo nucifera TaxID=4432 RepID=A0A822XG44_NELNU|nr:TPA_asm: hypothetical protein HUJ06_021927 [Nelumbo nucifera]
MRESKREKLKTDTVDESIIHVDEHDTWGWGGPGPAINPVYGFRLSVVSDCGAFKFLFQKNRSIHVDDDARKIWFSFQLFPIILYVHEQHSM